MVVAQKFDAESETVAFLLNVPTEAGLHYFEASIVNHGTTTRSTVLQLPGSVKENGEVIRKEIFQRMEEDAERNLKLLFVDKVGWIYYSYEIGRAHV